MEKNLIFNYSVKQIRFYIAIGVITILIGIGIWKFFPASKFADGFVVMGLVYLVQGVYYKSKPYVIICDGIICKNEFIVKRKPLQSFKSVLKRDEEYSFIDNQGQFKVNAQLLSKNDQQRFHEFAKEFKSSIYSGNDKT